ncbi:hypothetical protein BX616_009182 [Lobosporangium transversale]|nr:hypothetical protein BX616_009182 [Lobosporangium transversale]
MAPSYIVDPMNSILERRSLPILHKRAPPSEGDTEGSSSNNTAVIIGVSVGSLLLILSLALFYWCIRKRRASRRIGQLQRFLPTFMDQEKTEKYFQNQGSATTLVGSTQGSEKPPKGLERPSNVHHRTRSAPIAFTKSVMDHRNRQLERDGSLGQFQQISLVSEETMNEKESEHKRTLSRRSAITRSITKPGAAPAKSTLHRSVSLNKHNHEGTNYSRSEEPNVEEPEDSGHLGKFAEGESLVAPNRFSAFLDFSQPIESLNSNNRFSATSFIGVDPDFDPTRFSTASVMFDAKRISNVSAASSDDTASISSEEEFRHNIPPHQQQPSYHSHYNSPIEERTREEAVFNFGDKQELDEDEEVVVSQQQQQQQQQQPRVVQGYAGLQSYPRQPFYPALPQQHSPVPLHMPMPMPMPMPAPVAFTANTSPVMTPKGPGAPLPPSIKLSRPQDGQEMNLVVDDFEVNEESHHHGQQH